MAPVPNARITVIHDRPPDPKGTYVLYWMTSARRTRYNYALDRAIALARELGRPLLVLEALRCGYTYANDRIHQFVLDGMADNARRFDGAGIRHYPYVEPKAGAGKGLLRRLSQEACAVVTDQFPAFFLPRMLTAAAAQITVRLEAIDSNGLLPSSAADHAFPTAYAFRRHLQRALPQHLHDTPSPDPLKNRRLPPFDVSLTAVTQRWPETAGDVLSDATRVLSRLPIDHTVRPTGERGGETEARRRLRRFIRRGLSKYGLRQDLLDDDNTSGLSPYLHFGHISAHEVFAVVVDHEDWSPASVFPKASGSRTGWWGMSACAEAFLDQLVTWRELGFNMCARRDDYADYQSLPEWAQKTLRDHRRDARPFVYDLSDFASAATHDPLWNAAQRQLVREGRIHNYLRMLWGKKILEWSSSPKAALEIMLELNNRYALDGRDPNSYSGIFWCLGRYDRPWGPERPVFGKIRYMSSENTARKMDVKGYLENFRE